MNSKNRLILDQKTFETELKPEKLFKYSLDKHLIKVQVISFAEEEIILKYICLLEMQTKVLPRIALEILASEKFTTKLQNDTSECSSPVRRLTEADKRRLQDERVNYKKRYHKMEAVYAQALKFIKKREQEFNPAELVSILKDQFQINPFDLQKWFARNPIMVEFLDCTIRLRGLLEYDIVSIAQDIRQPKIESETDKLQIYLTTKPIKAAPTPVETDPQKFLLKGGTRRTVLSFQKGEQIETSRD